MSFTVTNLFWAKNVFGELAFIWSTVSISAGLVDSKLLVNEILVAILGVKNNVLVEYMYLEIASNWLLVKIFILLPLRVLAATTPLLPSLFK